MTADHHRRSGVGDGPLALPPVLEPIAEPPLAALPPAVHPAFRFVRAVGGIEEYRHVGNGLQVLLLPDDEDSARGAAAPVAALMVTYRVGSRNEGMGLTGATHLLEHLMFKGTERFNRDRGTSVFHVLQSVGAQVNATTWYDRTNYYAVLPSEHLALAAEVEADRMRGARVRDEDLASERTVVLNELDRGENEPLRRLLHAVYAVAFVAHPYGHPVIGWRSDVETVTAAGLRGFYDAYYWPRNATVSVVGRVDRAAALDVIHRHFGPIPAGPGENGNRGSEIGDREDIERRPSEPAVTREPEQAGERRVIVRQAGQLGAVLVAYKAPPGLDPDADALELLAVVLAGGKSGRLYRRLTDRGLTTGVSAFYPRLRDPGLFALYATLAPDVTHQAVESELRAILAEVARNGVTAGELTRARRQAVADEAFGRDGPFNVAAQLNEAIAVGDWTLYPTSRQRLENVAPEAVRAVARRVCLDDALTVGWYVPGEG